MSFRLAAKNHFLTYPRCDAAPNDLLLYLQSLEHPISWAVVCRELHQDGTPHMHAVIGYASKRDIRNNRYYDWNGHHPSIEGCRNVQQSIAYVKKDGVWVAFGDVPTQKRTWHDAVRASTQVEADEIIREIAPRDYILQRDRIESYYRFKYQRQVSDYTPEFPLESFDITRYPKLTEWLNQRQSGRRPKSLILSGPSRLGKTEWARAIGRHIYQTTFWNKDAWDDDAEYIVFDDCSEDTYCRNDLYKSFLGAQRDFSISGKYRGVTRVKGGIPAIWLTNKPLYSLSFPDMLWINANCIQVEINTPLF